MIKVWTWEWIYGIKATGTGRLATHNVHKTCYTKQAMADVEVNRSAFDRSCLAGTSDYIEWAKIRILTQTCKM